MQEKAPKRRLNERALLDEGPEPSVASPTKHRVVEEEEVAAKAVKQAANLEFGTPRTREPAGTASGAGKASASPFLPVPRAPVDSSSEQQHRGRTSGRDPLVAQWITRANFSHDTSTAGGGPGDVARAHVNSDGSAFASSGGGGAPVGSGGGGTWPSTSHAGSYPSWSGGGEHMPPAAQRGPHDSFNSHQNGPMPDYLKVYTVPRDIQMEEDVIIEPIIQSLKFGDAELEQRVTHEMSQLYEFFKRLYDSDQMEISSLQHELKRRGKELQRVQHKLSLASQQRLASPQKAAANAEAAPPPHKQPAPPAAPPVMAMVFPPVLDPARPFFKWWANVAASYRQNRVRWRCVALGLLLILFIGLIAGLVPGSGHRDAPVPYLEPGPAVTALYPTAFSFNVSLLEGATVYYAAVPAVALLTLRPPPEAEDVAGLLAHGTIATPLAGLATACGQRTSTAQQAHVVTLAAAAFSQAVDCAPAGVKPGRCGVCPDIQPSTSYVLLVAFEGSSALFSLPLTTSPAAGTPAAGTPAAGTPTAGTTYQAPPAAAVPLSLGLVSTPTVAPAGQSALNLTFAVRAAGPVRYMVVHATLYAQIGSVYAAFNTTAPADSLGALPEPTSTAVGVGGVVAAGVVNATSAGATYSCIIGADSSSGGGCSCASATSCACSLPAPCVGDLCRSTSSALVPSTTYQVYVFTTAADGRTFSSAVPAGSATTLPDTRPPALVSAAAVGLTVNPTGLSFSGVQLDSVGLSYVLVTQPRNGTALAVVAAGSATPFSEQPPASRRRSVVEGAAAVRAPWRSLAQVPSSDQSVVVLGATPASQVFVPSCPGSASCDVTQVARAYVDASTEALVASACVAGGDLKGLPNSGSITGLVNDTLYTVHLVTEDALRNRREYKSALRTTDLRPPTITSIATATAFTTFRLDLQLDEPGAIMAIMCAADDAASLTLSRTWPPAAQGPALQTVASDLGASGTGRTNHTLTFDAPGIDSNSNYAVYLLARDQPGNVQLNFTRVDVHTDDDQPPNWLLATVFPDAYFVSVLLQLDEPSTVYYWCLLGPVECPSAAEMFDATSSPPAGALVGTLVVQDPSVKLYTVGNLTDSADYSLCLIAQDTTSFRNRQAAPRLLDFTTLDRTPPALSAAIIPGSDGDVTCQRFAPYMCTLDLNITISELGSAVLWVLSNTSIAPPPSSQMLGSNLTGYTSTLVRGITLSFADATNKRATTPSLPSSRSYSVAVAAADLAGNVAAGPVVLRITAPDVVPPTFVQVSGRASDDTVITVSASLDEPCTIAFLALAANASEPSTGQVASSGAGMPSSVVLMAKGNWTYNATSSAIASWTVTGLLPGQNYSIYLLATDTTGNRQANVTSIRGIRTWDSAPPQLQQLSVLLPPVSGNAFTIQWNSSKPGVLYYVAAPRGSIAPTLQQLLQPASYAAANFSGQAQILAGAVGQLSSATLCVADARTLQLWAVQQDLEGQFAGRLPNYSNITRASMELPQDQAQTCDPATDMAAVQLDVGSAAGSVGWAVGQPVPSLNGSQYSWAQEFALWGGAGGGVGRTGMVTASVEQLQLPGALAYEVGRLPAAYMSIVLQTSDLYLELSNDPAGRSLSFAYQLRDRAMRSSVTTAGLRIVPSLTFAQGGGAAVALQDCALPAAGLPNGIGVCTATFGADLFPSPGATAAAWLTVTVYQGGVAALQAPSQSLTLHSAPSRVFAAAAAAAGVVVSLPYRPLHFGEIFTVTLTAVVNGNQTLSGFVVPVTYNATQVSFIRSQPSVLWSDVAVVPLQGGGSLAAGQMQLWLTGVTRTGADAMYSGTVPLADLTFMVGTNVVDTLPVMAVDTNLSLFPYSGTPPVLYEDYRAGTAGTAGGSGAGSIATVAAQPLAVFAYMANHDIFNTAGLNGLDVTVPIQVVSVSSWGPTADSTILAVSPDSCSVPAGSPALAFALDRCSIVASVSHTQPAKLAAVNVVYRGALSTQVLFSVWRPQDVTLSAADATLNKLLPVNAKPTSRTCLDGYQSTRLTVFASWRNGGNTTTDVLSNTVVTGLITGLSSTDAQALRITGTTVQGLLPRRSVTVSALGAGGQVLANASLAVSDEPVCVASIKALALTGAQVVSSGQPTLEGRWRVSVTPQQAFTWEGVTGRVHSVAALTDGTYMAVTATTTVTAQPGTNGVAGPFRLSQPSGSSVPLLQLNASFGAAPVCGSYLRADWQVCASVPMGTGQGTVKVAVPRPLRVASFAVQPNVITNAANGAAQAPMSTATLGYLQLMVEFDDGVTRDFTRSGRTELLVVQGGDLCQIRNGTSGPLPYVEARNSSLAGSCTLQAKVTVPGLIPLLATNTTTVVTLSALNVYVLDGGLAAPTTYNSTSITGLAVPGTPVRVFKCDFSNYEERTIWVMGRLSSCSSQCLQTDLTGPATTNLTLTDPSIGSLMLNAANISLLNTFAPSRNGTTGLVARFGSTVSRLNISVEDTFLPTWPRAANLTDNGFTLSAQTVSDLTISYWVVPSAQLDLAASTPSADTVEQRGVVLSKVNGSTAGAFVYEDQVQGLSPATNYTALLAVRWQSQLVRTVVAITNILTPDTQPPTFTSLGQIQNLTQDAQTFTLRLPVGVNEPSTVKYVVYRNNSCLAGNPPISNVLQGVTLGAPWCTCSDINDCKPVAQGSIALSGSVLQDTLTIQGSLPANPYAALLGVSDSLLTCGQGVIPAAASASHVLYLIAQDDLPTYKGWDVSCRAPASSPTSSCGAAALAPCTAVAPAFEPNNVQSRPYSILALSASTSPSLQGITSRPIQATFNTSSGEATAFDAAATTATVAGRTITFRFKVNKVSVVQYRVDAFDGTTAFSGIYPVFDPSAAYSVSISKDCSGALLADASYTLWYRATDIYGTRSPAWSAAVVFSS